MKRFHVHVAVSNLAESTRFYAALFGQSPTVEKDDYAKWMLDDPRINFAISTRGESIGVNHLGMQAEDSDELNAIHHNLLAADAAIQAEMGADCCYANSNKYWVTDPSGIAWESFHTLSTIPTFNGAANTEAPSAAATTACCVPTTSTTQLIKISSPTKGACCG